MRAVAGLLMTTTTRTYFATNPATKDPLFRSIEEMHAALGRKYGVILDAGTGGHSLKWLATLPGVEKIVAVSADLSAGEGKGAAELKSVLNDQRGDALVEGSWCAEEEGAPSVPQCDTILCDYLVGSMDGFRPFQQDRVFDELKEKFGEKGGLLHVVGLSPIYAQLGSQGYHRLQPAQQLVVDVARTRDACILLAGHRPYREFPDHWIRRQLTRSGFSVRTTRKFGVLWKHPTLKTQLDVARRKLPFFKDDALAQALGAKIDRLQRRADDLFAGDAGVSYGHDYVISATFTPDPSPAATTGHHNHNVVVENNNNNNNNGAAAGVDDKITAAAVTPPPSSPP